MAGDDDDSSMSEDMDDETSMQEAEEDSRMDFMPSYFRQTAGAKESAGPWYNQKADGVALDPVAEDDELSMMPAPSSPNRTAPVAKKCLSFEKENQLKNKKKEPVGSLPQKKAASNGDVMRIDIGTQFPETKPHEEEFDEEEKKPDDLINLNKPRDIDFSVPTDEVAMRASEYDPEKFWGYDLMFQFPWDVMENNKHERSFNQNKLGKDDSEQVEAEKVAQMSPRSKMLHQEYSPEMFASRCEAAGLVTSISSDPSNIYIRVGANWARYEKEAERIEFRKLVKQEFMNPAVTNHAEFHEDGLADEDPLRPPSRELLMQIYIPFTSEKRERFANSILSPNSLFSSAERQRLCQSVIEASLVMGGAGINIDPDSKRWGYSPGAPICLPDYDERDRLERLWHGGKPFGDHPGVFWRAQPFHEIREYYGEAITFYYLWMDCYIEWLVPLSIVGSICWIVYMLKDYWSYLENALAFYGTFVIFWAIFFMEAWNRREADFAFMWDCLGKTLVQREHWDFANRAELQNNPITCVIENYFDPEERESRVNKSMIIMALFMLLGLSFNVGSVILGGYLQDEITFQPAVGPAIGALALVIAQQVTKFIWDMIGESLTDWETHKYTTEYDQQLGFKIFGFELVMKFGAIFFIAFLKGPLGEDEFMGIKGCKDKDGELTGIKFCDYELMMQLLIVFMTEMTVGQFTEVVIPLVMVKVKNYLNNKAEKEAAEANGEEWVEAGVGIEVTVDENFVPPMTKDSQIRFLDEFGKQERCQRLSELYQRREGRAQGDWIQEDNENEAEKESFWMVGGPNLDYQEMMIQFGFVTLFSIAFPIVPFLALLNNLVEIRTDSLGMNETMQRPQYRSAPDIGAWKGSLNFMVWSSIVFNIVLMLYFNNYKADHQWFDGSDQFTLVGVVIGVEHVLIMFKSVCENFVPDHTMWLVKALENVDAMEKRANRDFTLKTNNYTGNLNDRKTSMVEQSLSKKGAIETEFKLYSDLKGMRAEVKSDWEKKVKEERQEWEDAAKEAEKARMEAEANEE